jgi:hypothetical protein
MFNYLIKGLLAATAIKLLDNYRHLSVQLLKIEAAKCYLRGAQIARLAAIGLMRMGLVIVLIGIGVLLLHAGLFILLPLTVESKAVLCLFLGLVYVAIGCFSLQMAMDEKTWMEKSGAAEILKKATSQDQEE